MVRGRVSGREGGREVMGMREGRESRRGRKEDKGKGESKEGEEGGGGGPFIGVSDALITLKHY